MEQERFILIGRDSHSGYTLAFPAHVLQQTLPPTDHRVPVRHHGSPQGTASDQGLPSQHMKRSSGFLPMEATGLTILKQLA